MMRVNDDLSVSMINMKPCLIWQGVNVTVLDRIDVVTKTAFFWTTPTRRVPNALAVALQSAGYAVIESNAPESQVPYP